MRREKLCFAKEKPSITGDTGEGHQRALASVSNNKRRGFIPLYSEFSMMRAKFYKNMQIAPVFNGKSPLVGGFEEGKTRFFCLAKEKPTKVGGRFQGSRLLQGNFFIFYEIQNVNLFRL